jgi:hypothetical protein
MAPQAPTAPNATPTGTAPAPQAPQPTQPPQAPAPGQAAPVAPSAPITGKEAQAAASDAAIKRYKLQYEGGQEEEVDEPTLIERAKKARTADQREAEARRVRGQVDELIRRARDPRDVWNVLQALGHDPRKAAEEFLIERLKEEQLTPEQRQVRQAQDIIKREEERKQEEQTQAQRQREQELSSRYSQEYSNQIISALQRNNLPKSEFTVKQMAYYMHQGLQRGVNLTAEDVAPLVKNYFTKQITDLLGATDSDMLLSLLGEDVAGKLRTADLKRLQNPKPAVPASEQPRPGPGAPGQAKRVLSMDEWRAQNERLKKS